MVLKLSILIKGGTIVTAVDTYKADIYIENEEIRAIGENLTIHARKVIDADELYIMPGGIDPHCHIQMNFGGDPTVDNYENSTIAAAFGGTTTIIDIAFQEKGKTLQEAIIEWHKKATGKAVIDYSFHAGITDPTENTINEMNTIVNQGIPSFKIFLSNPGLAMIDDDELIKIFQNASNSGSMIVIHAENGRVTHELARQAVEAGNGGPQYLATTRPPETEVEAVDRAILFAELTNTPTFFYHISTELSVKRIIEARSRGNAVFAETCPHYLYLTNDLITDDRNGAGYVVYPPLRTRNDQKALWKALKQNDLQVVSSDHCAYNLNGQKDRSPNDFRNVPGGLPGVETRLPLVYSGIKEGHLDLNRFVQLVSTNPAKIFGLYPQKGSIAIGSDADLVLWDPNVNWKIKTDQLHMPVDYTPFEGIEVQGKPQVVLSRGQIIIDDGEFVGNAGLGKFIKRKARLTL